MVVADDPGVYAHPLFVSITAPLAVACIVALVTSVARSLTTDRDLRRYVLPHFEPSRPGELDQSLPAKVERAEAKREEMVDQMVEPIIMGAEGLRKQGTVMLRKVAA